MRITFRTVFGIVPVPIVYTDRLLKDWQGAATRGPIVVIRTVYLERGDEGIHAHELEHVRQFWTMAASLAIVLLLVLPAEWRALGAALPLLAHPLLYRFARSYRLEAEVSAYRVQLEHQPAGVPVEWAADRLATCYDLRISLEDARALLQA